METLKYEIQTPRTARYFTLGELSPQTSHIWFVLHGYGQLANYFVNNFSSIAGPENFIVAPEGLSRFYLGENNWERVGASWMTKEDRAAEIQDQTMYLDRVLDQFAGYITINKMKVTILGFSQGAATAWRWLRDGRIKADNLVVWAGSIPGEFSAGMAEKLFKMNMFIAYGDQDEYIAEDDLQEKLEQLKTIKSEFETLKFKGGHQIPAEALEKLNLALYGKMKYPTE